MKQSQLRYSIFAVFQGLGDLPGGSYDSYAWGVSVIMGESITGSDYYEAFIWDADYGMRNLKDVLENNHGLDLTGWTLYGARGIANTNWI